MRGLNPFHRRNARLLTVAPQRRVLNKKEKTGSKPQITRIPQMDVPKKFAVRGSKNSSGTKMLMPETVYDWPPICGILTRSISGLRFQLRIQGLFVVSWIIDPTFI